MPHLILNGTIYPCADNESALDALNRGGAAIPSSCRNGVCQTCLLKAIEGPVPSRSQVGLKETLRAQNYFLACQCIPPQSLHIERPGAEAGRVSATIRDVHPLNTDTVALTLECPLVTEYHAGQFINIFQGPTTSRSYSLASVAGQDPHLILHIRRVNGGRVSGWIHDEVRRGDHVEITRPVGHCFYVPTDLDQPLLLLATGSGLAPLYGIARAALKQGHRGPIRLYHGSRRQEGLYLQAELLALSADYPHFHYHPCVSQEEPSGSVRRGRVLSVALQDSPKPSGSKAYLCGHPDMVASAKKALFVAGIALKDIYADPFVRAAS